MKQSTPILLVEDDRIDAMTVRRAFRELQVVNQLVHVGNGEEALEYLRKPENPVPGIILLDLNMPKMNGIEFLRIAKNDENLRRIPVIVLTTSKEDQDRFESFDLCVAGYMIKPVDYSQFVNTMKVVRDYWTTSELSSM